MLNSTALLPSLSALGKDSCLSVSTPLYCSLRCFFLAASTRPSASFSSLAPRHSYLRGHESLPLHFILNGPPLIRPLPSPSSLPLPLFSHCHLLLIFLSLSTFKKSRRQIIIKKKKGEPVLCALGLSPCAAKRTRLFHPCSSFGTKRNLKSCKSPTPIWFHLSQSGSYFKQEDEVGQKTGQDAKAERRRYNPFHQ